MRPMAEATELGLVDFARIIWRHKFLILALGILAAGADVRPRLPADEDLRGKGAGAAYAHPVSSRHLDEWEHLGGAFGNGRGHGRQGDLQPRQSTGGSCTPEDPLRSWCLRERGGDHKRRQHRGAIAQSCLRHRGGQCLRPRLHQRAAASGGIQSRRGSDPALLEDRRSPDTNLSHPESDRRPIRPHHHDLL